MEEGSIIPEGLASADAANGASKAPSAPLTPAAVLRAAADLIEPEGRWTRDALGRDADGRRIHYGDDFSRATCFCASGAIHVAGDFEPVVNSAYEALQEVVGRTPVPVWNDRSERTQAEVVAALRAAADLADASGQDGQGPVRAETPAKQSGTNDQ